MWLSHFGHGIVQCSPTWTSNRIYSNPTHDKHQWLLLQFIVLLKMDTKGVRNMYSILVVSNKQNTARVASCWFIIYYRLEMHGNSNIKLVVLLNYNTMMYFTCTTGSNIGMIKFYKLSIIWKLTDSVTSKLWTQNFLYKMRKTTIIPHQDNCFLDWDWTRVLQEWNQELNNIISLFV